LVLAVQGLSGVQKIPKQEDSETNLGDSCANIIWTWDRNLGLFELQEEFFGLVGQVWGGTAGNVVLEQELRSGTLPHGDHGA